MPSPVVTDKTYEFISPHEGRIWPRVLRPVVRRHLRKQFGVTEVEVRGADKLSDLMRAGHGILLAPNHCRMGDALVLQALSNEVKHPFFVMASSHLFHGGKALAWALRKLGAFSVYREGVDRTAVKTAIDILTTAKRPLIIFPEGALSRANDHLNALMEGVPFIAHAAARKLEKQSATKNAGVVVVPVGIKYLFKGDIQSTLEPMLSNIEERLVWHPQRNLSLFDRIYKIGHALITLKEIQYFGAGQPGELDERLNRLIDHLLVPLEDEWLDGKRSDSVFSRVKELRKAVIPNMIEGELSDDEHDRRWLQLDAMDLAQHMSLYPRRYLASRLTVDRMLETAERMEESLSGAPPTPPPMTAVVQVGDSIEVTSRRSRDGDGLLGQVESSLQSMLDSLSVESRMFEPESTAEAKIVSNNSADSSD